MGNDTPTEIVYSRTINVTEFEAQMIRDVRNAMRKGMGVLKITIAGGEVKNYFVGGDMAPDVLSKLQGKTNNH